jgi:hypothetical protein
MSRYQPSGLTQHDPGGVRGDRAAEQAISAAIPYLVISPFRKFLGRRHMADLPRATAHDKTEHHFIAIACLSPAIVHPNHH